MVNPNANVAKDVVALNINISAAKSLQDILKTNLGPKGTMKMLVGGSGDIKLTKDGGVLLGEMQIQHPTAQMIARTATAQDDITGDGTTSTVLLIGDLLVQAARYLAEGMHPSTIIEGYELAQKEALNFLDEFKVPVEADENGHISRDILYNLARSAISTKVSEQLCNSLSDIVVDAISVIQRKGKELDLHMVEIQHMEHQMDTETQLIKGLVLDHGTRHPNMRKSCSNCFILTCNVSLEYEKTEVNAGIVYHTAEEREELVQAERFHCDEKVRAIIDLKKKVCKDGKTTFVVINQKGIDPMSLDMFVKEGIFAVRRAKRRNMERVTLACGGVAVNSIEDLDESVLGYCKDVHEVVLGENKYTFVEGVQHPHSCTILIKGPNKHSIRQVKDAIRDGLRAVKNGVVDKCFVPGAAAFEVACHSHLIEYAKSVKGKPKLGVEAFAKAMLCIPKTLAANSGYDSLDAVLKLQDEFNTGAVVGLDIYSGEPDVISPEDMGILDNYRVKRQCISAATFTATQLLFCDEIIQAGRNTRKK